MTRLDIGRPEGTLDPAFLEDRPVRPIRQGHEPLQRTALLTMIGAAVIMDGVRTTS